MGDDTRFKKGLSGNPSGRPKLPSELLQLKRVTTQEFESVIFNLLQSDESALDNLIKNKTASNLERLVASIIVRSMDGDSKFVEMLLTRAFGKPKETIDLNENPLARMSDEEKLEKAKFAVEILTRRLQANE